MSRALHLNEASPTYSGALAKGNGLRLIVSARGAVYALQDQAGDRWSRVRSFPTGRALAAHVAVVLIDPAAAIAQAVVRLPDDPRDCELVPFKARVRSAP